MPKIYFSGQSVWGPVKHSEHRPDQGEKLSKCSLPGYVGYREAPTLFGTASNHTHWIPATTPSDYTQCCHLKVLTAVDQPALSELSGTERHRLSMNRNRSVCTSVSPAVLWHLARVVALAGPRATRLRHGSKRKGIGQRRPVLL